MMPLQRDADLWRWDDKLTGDAAYPYPRIIAPIPLTTRVTCAPAFVTAPTIFSFIGARGTREVYRAQDVRLVGVSR